MPKDNDKSPYKKPKYFEGLTDQQAEYVMYFLLSGNKQEALRRANYGPTVSSAKIHNNKDVQLALNRYYDAVRRKFVALHDKTINELAKLAFDDVGNVNIADVLEWNDNGDIVNIKKKSDIPKKALQHIKSIKQIISKDGDFGVQVEMKEGATKLQALKLLSEKLQVWKQAKIVEAYEESIDGDSDNKSGTNDPDRLQSVLENYLKQRG